MLVPLGTISHGTLRDEDLVPAFLSALERFDSERAAWLRSQYAEVIPLIGTKAANKHVPDGEENSAEEHIQFLFDDLFDALNEVAPPGYYFGPLEGDPTDFGFWESRLGDS